MPLALLGACSSRETVTWPATPTATFLPLVGQIAFVSTRDGSPFIYVAAADGSSLRRLTTGQDPDWSWDGRQIVFTGADSLVHVINTDGTGERVLPDSGSTPHFAPDGGRISFTTALGLYVANIDGSNPTLLVPSSFRLPGNYVEDGVWSPDGTRIAFVSGGPDPWDGDEPPGVYVVKADGSVGVEGTASPAFFPRWSPDGSTIVYGTWQIPIIVSKPDGSDARPIELNPWPASVDWSPDGRSLLFIAGTESSGLRIFVTDTSFRASKRVVPDAVTSGGRRYDDYSAVWSRAVVR